MEQRHVGVVGRLGPHRALRALTPHRLERLVCTKEKRLVLIDLVVVPRERLPLTLLRLDGGRAAWQAGDAADNLCHDRAVARRPIYTNLRASPPRDYRGLENAFRPKATFLGLEVPTLVDQTLRLIAYRVRNALIARVPRFP